MRHLSRLLGVLLLVLPVAAFLYSVQRQRHRQLLLPGQTSSGHHQIEDKCELCHTPLAGVKEEACTGCHAAALAAQHDTHAPDKFLDPGRADMLTSVDARSCLPCHREHRPEARQRGSLSVASDFCLPCHGDVKQRPDHRDLSASSCADTGCHNYHDNRALYGDLLKREREAPALRTAGALPLTSTIPARGPALSISQADLTEVPVGSSALPSWARSSHAAAGVNCQHCHGNEQSKSQAGAPPGAWPVPPAACGTCHADQRTGFLAGKHGMRLAAGLGAMQPHQARLPMKPAAHDRSLDCNSCHRSHDFDRREAAVEACEGCHDDRHTRAYRGSSHFALLQGEWAGRADPGSGVSCASCHLPRREFKQADGGRKVMAFHNQNDNLRPADRMAREVCMHCHGLGYSLQALADRNLIERNFIGAPDSGGRTGMTLVKEERR